MKEKKDEKKYSHKDFSVVIIMNTYVGAWHS